MAGSKKVTAQETAPKKPTNPYMFWLNSCRAELSKKYPDHTGIKLTSVAAKEWKDLPEKQRESWNKKFQAAQEKYGEDRKKWEAAHPQEAKQLAEQKAAKKQKRAQSAEKPTKKTQAVEKPVKASKPAPKKK